ncbi:RNA polymerase sigma-70 factor [Galbibacter sp. PAP.153]|uniref:RNA polymerase sigma-70 factor n=1 Tax=Galbibacter sp. PAP.153 TaxID=3104623 RepID=UPI003008AB50
MEKANLNIHKTSADSDNDSLFDHVFRLYYDKLLHIALGYLNCKEDAEEIVQNTFLKLWERRKQIDKIANLNNYLYTLTKNGCLDLVKHQKIKIGYSRQHQTMQQEFINDQAASLLIENELKSKIDQSIELLPEKCRQVFVKSRVEGLKRNEIATILNISPRTVDNHIANALKHMKFHLRDFISFLF